MFAENLAPEKLSYPHLREGRLCPRLRGDKLRQVSIFSARVDFRLRGKDKQKGQTKRTNKEDKHSVVLFILELDR